MEKSVKDEILRFFSWLKIEACATTDDYSSFYLVDDLMERGKEKKEYKIEQLLDLYIKSK